MATLERLLRDAFGAARDVDAGRAATRPVTWVRVLRARVPAFDALDPGDLVIVPAASLGVVAPTDPQIDELAAALAGAGIPAVLLVHADGDPPGDLRLGRLGERLAATEVTAIDLGVADPQAVERRLLATLLDGRRGADATTGDGATP